MRITSLDNPDSRGEHGPGEMRIRTGFKSRICVQRDLVVALHLQFHVQLAELLHEVVGERIVIVDDQNHIRTHNLIQRRKN